MASRSLRHLVEQKMGTFAHFVMYVLLEWMLIVLLFIDGALAFLSNEFAKYFDLRIPCLLCTRIDHVLVHRSPDFYYNDSICESHKKSISRMAFCHVHKKLSDIRNMCEGCLLSFATGKEADCDTYKSLVGILNKDLECFVEDDSKIHLKFPGAVRRDEDIIEVEKSSPEHFCSCCGEALKVKLTFPRGNAAGAAVSNKMKQVSGAPTPSPRAPHASAKYEAEPRSLDLPHIPYTELKSLKGSQSPLEEETSNALASDAKMPLLTDAERLNEDSRTPIFTKGNKYFGLAVADSPTASPRWTTRVFRKSPLEKTEYTLESGDGNVANFEIDGESILHRLKRQVRLDRKSLIELYMELDEERSASTEAANNAMAMITRLQAEKAAVQMEALQYQRMMEEQAEYDQEAIQVMKELLDKREDEIRALEAELEVYRDKYGEIAVPLPGIDEYEEGAVIDYQELKSHSSFSERSESVQNSPFSIKDHHYGDPIRLTDLDLENERSALLKQVKRLQSRLQMVPEDAANSLESTSDSVDQKDETHGLGGAESKAALTREVSSLTQRLQALEEDSKFLKQAAHTLEKSEEGAAVLSEIAQNLRKLRVFGSASDA
uniref:GTD-binding domain-containing protein n=1 Tax=Kalanchoe fedtschenkoi TaxID=63787 RepID=A0A7N0U1P0_KALFE